MLRSMSSAISGMQAFQTDLDVVGNNIANVNTVGFKSSSANFADILSQTTSGGNAASYTQASPTGLGGTNPQQVGLGVKVASTALDFSQGSTETTSSPTDLLVNGAGLFTVQDATGGLHYTRAGDFSVDSSHNLVLPNGFLAVGYPADSSGKPIFPTGNASGQPSQPINLDQLMSSLNLTNNGSPVTLAQAPDVQVGNDGSISVTGSDQQRHIVGYLSLASFPNNQGLEKQGDNLFGATSASGSAQYSQPGQNNTGTLQSGALEMSNVDLAKEFSEMIVAQNGFVANSHMIGTDNQVLQALVTMKNS